MGYPSAGTATLTLNDSTVEIGANGVGFYPGRTYSSDYPVINASAANISCEGNWNLIPPAGTGSITFNAGTSTVTFDGTTQTIYGATTFYDLVVASSTQLDINSVTIRQYRYGEHRQKTTP